MEYVTNEMFKEYKCICRNEFYKISSFTFFSILAIVQAKVLNKSTG